jgi:hypothetical protein
MGKVNEHRARLWIAHEGKAANGAACRLLFAYSRGRANKRRKAALFVPLTPGGTCYGNGYLGCSRQGASKKARRSAHSNRVSSARVTLPVCPKPVR